MDMQQSEFDRLLFFEHARKAAEAEYAKNPLDADVRILLLWIHFPLYLFDFYSILGFASEYLFESPINVWLIDGFYVM